MPFRFRLIPEALLSAPVFWFSLLWVFVVQFGEGVGLGDSPINVVARFSLLFFVQVVMFAFPYVTWHLICPRVPSRTWIGLLLASVFIGAAVRGIAFGFLLYAFGVTDSLELVFRVAASLSHLAVITVMLWFLVSEVRGLTSRRRQLIADRDQLRELQLATQSELESLGDRVTDEIRQSIMESLGGLHPSDSITSSTFRERLRLTIDDVVRPLSHQLAAQPQNVNQPQSPEEPTKVNWNLAVREGLNPARIHPVFISILLVWLGIPIHVFQFDPGSVVGLLTTLIFTIPAFLIARRVGMWLSANRGSVAKAVTFVVAVLFGGATLGLATLPYMQDQPQPLIFLVVGPPLALLISGPLAIAEAARSQNLELEWDLKSTTDDLRWTLARTREQYRQRERAVAHALHGRVQATLAAAFLRIDRAVEQGVDDDHLLTSLQAEIREVINELDFQQTEPDPVAAVIALTGSNWSGTATLKESIDPEAKELLSGDLLCARSVNDLIPELVFNSVRHGSASEIEVRLTLIDSKTMSLTVIDNGSGEIKITRHGLGSQLLNDATISWTRDRDGGLTTTSCVLPLLVHSLAPGTPNHSLAPGTPTAK